MLPGSFLADVETEPRRRGVLFSWGLTSSSTNVLMKMLLGTDSIIPSTTTCVSIPQPLPAKNAPANISGRRGYFYEQLL